MSAPAKGEAALAKMEAMLDRQLGPVRAELAATRGELAALRELIVGPRDRLSGRPLSRRGLHPPEEAERIVAWLEAHRDEWAHLSYAGTVRGWLAGRSRPSRRMVLQLWLNPLNPPTGEDGEPQLEPGLERTEPELESLLAGEAS